MAWTPITGLVNPVQITWRVSCDWGISRIRLFADWAGAVGQPEVAVEMAKTYWALLWAPALSISTICELIETVHLVDPSYNRLLPSPGLSGVVLSGCAPRSETPVFVLDSGLLDPMAKRRLYFPGAAAACVNNGKLTTTGQEKMLTIARTFYLTGNQEQPGQFIQHILVRNRRVPGGPIGSSVVEWTTVRQVRVCEQTAKAPAGV